MELIMANTKYTEVTNQLESLLKSSPRNSESQNALACGRAQEIVRDSNKLTQDEKIAVLRAISSKANNRLLL